jgi:hypothetical protein
MICMTNIFMFLVDLELMYSKTGEIKFKNYVKISHNL